MLTPTRLSTMPDTAPDSTRIPIRRYAAGKIYCSVEGATAFATEAQTALAASVSLEPVIDEPKFLSLLAAAGVPRDIALRYARTFHVQNEVWLQDVYPR